MLDVGIAGGGPAGAMAALHLARAGLRVAIFDKHVFPRDKVCGDALIPDSLRVLDRAGLLDRVRAVSSAPPRLVLYSPSGIPLPIDTQTLVIKRREFDAMLIAAAAEAGAAVHHAEVTRFTNAGLVLRDGSLVPARVIVLATGADVRLVERLAPSAVAIRTYMRSKTRIDDLVLSFHRPIAPGYAWIFPLPNGEYNVGCGVTYGSRIDLRHTLDTFLRTFPPARELAAGMESMTPIAGATLRAGLRGTAPFRAPNVLAIGETIGTTFPLSGEGIGKAMETGEIAARVITRALAANDLSLLAQYATDVEQLRPRYAGYAAAQKWVARPWLNELVFRLAHRSTYARHTLAGVLDESIDPRALMSIRGLWRSLTR